MPFSNYFSDSLPWEVDCRTVQARRAAGEDVVLLDCREPDEFAIGVIDGAVLLPMSQLETTGRLPVVQPPPRRGPRGGRVVKVLMPAAQTGSPMTYMLNGRQFVVVAVGGPGAAVGAVPVFTGLRPRGAVAGGGVRGAGVAPGVVEVGGRLQLKTRDGA